jgi:ectoine hydroxylase-related dioxygenase (phytanoyl-CoA dioxygenase family)
MENLKDDIDRDGFMINQQFYSESFIDEIIEQLDRSNALQYDKLEISEFNLITRVPFVEGLAHSHRLISLVKQVIGDNALPTNAFVLDKTQNNNWGLDWHQDLKIAVRRKIETNGFYNWTIESGVNHTIPPREILEKRLSVRIHLDDCFTENGAILISPKSNQYGIIKNKAEVEKITRDNILYCEINKGGIMFITPLLLHKSPYSITYKKRRILQIDYVGSPLPNGLEWYS